MNTPSAEPSISYRPATGYILLDLPMVEALPDTWQNNGETYERKSELHVSILNARAVAASQHMPESSFAATAEEVFAQHAVTFQGYRRPLYACQKDGGTSRSIIAPVEVIGLQAAFEALAYRTHRNLSLPLRHVTLYTHGDKQGIAVKDSMMLALRCQQIIAPDLERILFDSVDADSPHNYA